MSAPEFVYCGHCEKDVHYHYDPVNHLTHFVLSVCSLGLWLPIWVGVTVKPSKICDGCGNPIWSDPPSKPAVTRRNPS